MRVHPKGWTFQGAPLPSGDGAYLYLFCLALKIRPIGPIGPMIGGRDGRENP